MGAPGLALASEFRSVRERTERIFAMVAPEAFYERPIPLRHPLAFYEGHLDAFNDTRLQRRFGLAPLAPALDRLFERGIDPCDAAAASRHRVTAWPSRDEVRAYTGRLRDRLFDCLEKADRGADPGFFHLLLEHELMHQETLVYLLHQLPFASKRPPEAVAPLPEGTTIEGMVPIPSGVAVLGRSEGFGWDNEFPRHEVTVPAFAIDRTNVTNGAFLVFVEDGGYARSDFWSDRTWAWRSERGLEHPHYWRRQGDSWKLRGLFAEEPLPLDQPVLVTHAEAEAYARYVGKALPSEAEWHRAACGEGTDVPLAGNFDFRHWGATPVGAYPEGASPYGVQDMVGNGWEWTRTPFMPFEGFEPSEVYPAYSADFFDGAHYVLKGASWVTDRRLVRSSLRNWFYWHYPYMYATFRCVGW